MKAADFDGWVRDQLAVVEHALERWVPAAAPAGLGEAMRYGVLDGGKRLRPLLVMAACDAAAGERAPALRAAVAVELIHAYSLIHDDMPCMDNDVSAPRQADGACAFRARRRPCSRVMPCRRWRSRC